MKEVSYEWKIELLDEWGEIEDCVHCEPDNGEGLEDHLTYFAPRLTEFEVCLVRDVAYGVVIDGRFEGELEDRQHAYVDLETVEINEFDDGTPVPIRFKREVDDLRRSATLVFSEGIHGSKLKIREVTHE